MGWCCATLGRGLRCKELLERIDPLEPACSTGSVTGGGTGGSALGGAADMMSKMPLSLSSSRLLWSLALLYIRLSPLTRWSSGAQTVAKGNKGWGRREPAAQDSNPGAAGDSDFLISVSNCKTVGRWAGIWRPAPSRRMLNPGLKISQRSGGRFALTRSVRRAGSKV